MPHLARLQVDNTPEGAAFCTAVKLAAWPDQVAGQPEHGAEPVTEFGSLSAFAEVNG